MEETAGGAPQKPHCLFCCPKISILPNDNWSYPGKIKQIQEPTLSPASLFAFLSLPFSLSLSLSRSPRSFCEAQRYLCLIIWALLAGGGLRYRIIGLRLRQ